MSTTSPTPELRTGPTGDIGTESLPAPEILRGRYEPLGEAASGGQASLLKAVDLVHRRPVALKVRLLGSELERRRAQEEASVLYAVRPHPGIALLREDFVADDRYVQVIDWIDGETLQAILEREGSPGLPPGRVLGWLQGVASAIDHLHAQDPVVVHLDVKPSNIMLADDGRVVLIDFGVAHRASTELPATGGTGGFRAPELLRGQLPAPAADVYGLAASAVCLLTGRPPQDGVAPAWDALPAAVRRPVSAVLRRGLASDPEARPATASAFVAELCDALGSEVRASGTARAGGRVPRKWLAVIAPAIVVLSAAMAAVLIATRPAGSPSAPASPPSATPVAAAPALPAAPPGLTSVEYAGALVAGGELACSGGTSIASGCTYNVPVGGGGMLDVDVSWAPQASMEIRVTNPAGSILAGSDRLSRGGYTGATLAGLPSGTYRVHILRHTTVALVLRIRIAHS